MALWRSVLSSAKQAGSARLPAARPISYRILGCWISKAADSQVYSYRILGCWISKAAGSQAYSYRILGCWISKATGSARLPAAKPTATGC